jgi:hypothetical protein
MSHALDRRGQQATLDRVVVDDEDLAGHPSLPVARPVAAQIRPMIGGRS